MLNYSLYRSPIKIAPNLATVDPCRAPVPRNRANRTQASKEKGHVGVVLVGRIVQVHNRGTAAGKQDRQVRSLRLRSAGILLDPVGYFALMRRGPIRNVLGVRGIRTYPRLCRGVVRVRPLRDDVRLSAARPIRSSAATSLRVR